MQTGETSKYANGARVHFCRNILPNETSDKMQRFATTKHKFKLLREICLHYQDMKRFPTICISLSASVSKSELFKSSYFAAFYLNIRGYIHKSATVI